MMRYSARRPCSKCGAVGASSKYVHEMDIALSRDPDETRTRHIEARIERRCGTCGYQWKERPLDATPEPTDEHR